MSPSSVPVDSRSRSIAPDPRPPGEVLVEQGARPAQPGRVDADPPVPGAQQRRAGGFDACQIGLGHRRVVDHRRPGDERFLAEPALAVVGRRFAGDAAQADAGRDEVLGAEQFDAEPGELGRRGLDELVGLLEVELDRRGLVHGGQLVQPGDVRRHRRGEREQLVLEVGDPALATGDVERPRRAFPHVVGRAPFAGVGVVDQLELDQPRVEGVVGQRQPHPSAHDRLAVEAAAGAGRGDDRGRRSPRRIRRRPLRITGSGLASAANTARTACTSARPLAAEVGLPAAVVEHGPGQPVDQRARRCRRWRRSSRCGRSPAPRWRRGRARRGARR